MVSRAHRCTNYGPLTPSFVCSLIINIASVDNGGSTTEPFSKCLLIE